MYMCPLDPSADHLLDGYTPVLASTGLLSLMMLQVHFCALNNKSIGRIYNSFRLIDEEHVEHHKIVSWEQ